MCVSSGSCIPIRIVLLQLSSDAEAPNRQAETVRTMRSVQSSRELRKVRLLSQSSSASEMRAETLRVVQGSFMCALYVPPESSCKGGHLRALQIDF